MDLSLSIHDHAWTLSGRARHMWRGPSEGLPPLPPYTISPSPSPSLPLGERAPSRTLHSRSVTLHLPPLLPPTLSHFPQPFMLQNPRLDPPYWRPLLWPCQAPLGKHISSLAHQSSISTCYWLPPPPPRHTGVLTYMRTAREEGWRAFLCTPLYLLFYDATTSHWKK